MRCSGGTASFITRNGKPVARLVPVTPTANVDTSED